MPGHEGDKQAVVNAKKRVGNIGVSVRCSVRRIRPDHAKRVPAGEQMAETAHFPAKTADRVPRTHIEPLPITDRSDEGTHDQPRSLNMLVLQP